MIRYSTPRQTTSSKLSSSSRLSEVKRYMLRRRCWLGTLCVVVVIVMMIGGLFTAHQYHYDFGGQGWLKCRDQRSEGSTKDGAQLFLPMRQIQMFRKPSVFERQAGIDIPFYTCGDQQNSCESFHQPDICCPVGTACYAATFTNSGIYCCHSTSNYQCEATQHNPPKCMASLVECSKETGGGCCPSIMECSPNGCVHVNNASVISSVSTASFTGSSAFQSSLLAPSTTSSSPGTPITITTTILQAPAATVTLAKEGEVATAGVGKGSTMRMRLWTPYSAALFVFCIAVVMGRLQTSDYWNQTIIL